MRLHWKLGRALAEIERATGPGRGKKAYWSDTSFRLYLKEIGLDRKLGAGALAEDGGTLGRSRVSRRAQYLPAAIEIARLVR
jgi:hypothetical protein